MINGKFPNKQVSIVVDSAVSLPPTIIKQFNLFIVPMIIIVDNKSYKDGSDLRNSDFYELQQNAKSLPTTSAPNPYAFLKQFRLASQDYNQVLCLTVGSSFSSSYQAAQKAVLLAEIEMPNVRIKLLDTQTAAAGEALIALEAARLVSEGLDLDRIVSHVQLVINNVSFMAILDNLLYLHKGGRVPLIGYWLSYKLNIKPIFGLIQGKVKILANPRHYKTAPDRLFNILKGRTLGSEIKCIVTHANSLALAENLSNQIRSHLNCVDLFVSECGPVLGAHTGPNLLGVSFFKTECLHSIITFSK